MIARVAKVGSARRCGHAGDHEHAYDERQRDSGGRGPVGWHRWSPALSATRRARRVVAKSVVPAPFSSWRAGRRRIQNGSPVLIFTA